MGKSRAEIQRNYRLRQKTEKEAEKKRSTATLLSTLEANKKAYNEINEKLWKCYEDEPYSDYQTEYTIEQLQINYQRFKQNLPLKFGMSHVALLFGGSAYFCKNCGEFINLKTLENGCCPICNSKPKEMDMVNDSYE